MVVLGIDPGLADIGWGVISSTGNRHTHLAHGTIKTKAGIPMELRLLDIFNALEQIIDTYKPTQAGIETLRFVKNITSALPVAQARGVALLALAKKGILIGEYAPLQIKSAVVGIGQAEKAQVQAMVKLLLGLKEIPKPDHAADALAAAICHLNLTGGSLLAGKFH